MPRGTLLPTAVKMLKAELGVNIVPGVATQADETYRWLIHNKQQQLASEYDWPFLETRRNVIVDGGTRMPLLPHDAGIPVLSLDRPIVASVRWNDCWLPLDYGIDNSHFDLFDSDASVPETQDPTQRWMFVDDGVSFELWPIPTSDTIVRFVGRKPMFPLHDVSGTFDETAVLTLDDQLIILYVAADILARKGQKDAPLMLRKAEQRLSKLRAVLPTRSSVTVLRGAYMPDRCKCIKRVAIAGSSSSGSGMGIMGESGSVVPFEP